MSDLIAAVVTAGGLGQRIGGPSPKQFIELCGLPMIIHTLRAFENCSLVNEVVVTLPLSELGHWTIAEFQKYDCNKVTHVVLGGKTRQESVWEGLKAVNSKTSIVAVHDAARCLITSSLIEKTIHACKGYDGAILSLPVRDTLKEVQSDAIVRTIPRDQLWAMQTPQVFQFDFILNAYKSALESSYEATDDSAIAEFVKGDVKVVMGDTRNFKVTFPEDIDLAAMILEQRGA